MGCACIRVFLQRRGQTTNVSRQDNKIMDASLLQIRQKAILNEAKESSSILSKQQYPESLRVSNQQNHHYPQSPIGIIVQDDVKLQKQAHDNIGQKIPQLINIININNQYEFLLSSLQEMECSERGTFLQGYVFKNIRPKIIFQSDKDKVMVGVALGMDFVAQGLISLRGVICALMQSLHKVHQVYIEKAPASIEHQQQDECNSQAHRGTFAATLFYNQLEAQIYQLIADRSRVVRLWANKQVVLSNKNACQEQQSRQMKSQMSTSQMSAIYYSLQNQLLQQCQVCLCPIQPSFMARLQGCPHLLHFQCMHEHIKSSINSNIIEIRCPIQNCINYLTANDIENYLDNDLMNKYYQITLNKYVQVNSDVTSWCPTAGCSVVFEYEDGINRFNCPLCMKRYCLYCRAEYHQHLTCRQYQEMSHEEKTFISFVKGSKFKQCPRCKFWVERTTGCNIIKCRCGISFCYDCGGESCGHYGCNNPTRNRN